MRLIIIEDISVQKYYKIRNAIFEIIPFALINSEYINSMNQNNGYFYFWDTEYIPECLRHLAVRPPKTHENVELLHKKLLKVLD